MTGESDRERKERQRQEYLAYSVAEDGARFLRALLMRLEHESTSETDRQLYSIECLAVTARFCSIDPTDIAGLLHAADEFAARMRELRAQQ